jgi:hypothetical protein
VFHWWDRSAVQSVWIASPININLIPKLTMFSWINMSRVFIPYLPSTLLSMEFDDSFTCWKMSLLLLLLENSESRFDHHLCLCLCVCVCVCVCVCRHLFPILFDKYVQSLVFGFNLIFTLKEPDRYLPKVLYNLPPSLINNCSFSFTHTFTLSCFLFYPF